MLIIFPYINLYHHIHFFIFDDYIITLTTNVFVLLLYHQRSLPNRVPFTHLN